MKLKEIMTQDVIAVRPSTPVHDAARLMVDHGVSGLPVVDDEGRLIGIVSDGDLILRQKPRGRIRWWRLFFADGERLAREYQKAVGTTVAEVMTRDVISASPELPVGYAAAILDQHGIRRLPIVSEGRLVGIVSRGDLIKALAKEPARDGAPLADAEVEREMRARMAREPWVTNRGILVQARAGIVSIWGIVASEAEQSALETMARSIQGAKGVDSHLLIKAEIPYHYGL